MVTINFPAPEFLTDVMSRYTIILLFKKAYTNTKPSYLPQVL